MIRHQSKVKALLPTHTCDVNTLQYPIMFNMDLGNIF